ncbi:MAG: hypothetical protein MK101_10145 [Phycisphaerales bacterium]|nr:hypothetical protein [Phycisphaerales bacterium]
MGGTAKLIEGSPRLLPEHLRKLIDGAVDLHVALIAFIVIEFIAAALMVLRPRLARPTALFMLGSFCLVLIWEMINGNFTDCGCLASISPPPWLMLTIDAALLIGVCALPVPDRLQVDDRIGWAGVTLVAIAVASIAIMHVQRDGVMVPVTPVGPEGAGDGTGDPGSTTEPPLVLPAYYQPDPGSWAGTSVRDINLVKWTPGLPADLDEGRRYLIYYSRTCEHCHELLLSHFEFDLPAPTTIIAIPESADGFTEDGQLDNPCLECGDELQLPVGVDWLITPPVVIAIEDGVVQCAQEAEDAFDPACLPWHGY